MSGFNEKALQLTIRAGTGPERTFSKYASPRVSIEKCLNCGMCIENCPTGAIFELQRQICRLCPDCAEGGIMFPQEIEELTGRSCSRACPLGHYPEGYLNLVAGGDWEAAWNVVNEINPLPGVLGRICARPCEEECKRGMLIDKPMHIRATKRAIADWAFANGKTVKKLYRRSIDKRVAVVGGGPAGITAASDLAAMGYKVTIFEKTGSLGGMVRSVIPTFRLPDEIWKREFELALGNGIDVQYGVSVGKSPTIQELLDDGFKAVVLAIGTPRGKKLPIPGSDFKGVYDALTYMNNVKYGVPVETGEKTVVIGGGSVATDAARTARRMGAKSVTMVCIEPEGCIPALCWEFDEAVREGVKIMPGYAPLKISSAWMRAESISLAKVKSIATDPSGRISLEIDETKTEELSADTVIFAVGQELDEPLINRIGLKRNEKGGIVMEEDSLATSIEGVFAAGDAAGGASSVVDAMASARKAAKAVDGYLMNKSAEDGTRPPGGAPLNEEILPIRLEKLTPLTLKELTVDEALSGFAETQASSDFAGLQADARRCMRCGYVEVDHQICVGCGICQRVCPAGDVITMGSPLSGGEKR